MVWDSSICTEAKINKNHVSILFHLVCEAVVSHVIRFGFLKVNNIMAGFF